MPITLKTITLFHCVCIRCKHEWDSPTKPKRCAGCKYRTWNGEDHRFADPYDGVPQTSQIATGTDAPQLPNYLPLLGTLTAAREVVSKVVETGPCKHKQFHCVCAATEVLADLDQRIEQLNAMRPLRKTYLTRKRRAKAAEAVSQ